MENLGNINVFNTYAMGGFCLMILGYSSSFKFFSGRRITLIVGSIVLAIIWNILWVILSDIHISESQEAHFTEYDLPPFDKFMYRGECALTFMTYQALLCAGPIDISK